MIRNNQNDSKGTWRVLNQLIKRKRSSPDYPDTFQTEDGTLIKEEKNIANKFNDFFVNIGPKLASKINQPKKYKYI